MAVTDSQPTFSGNFQCLIRYITSKKTKFSWSFEFQREQVRYFVYGFNYEKNMWKKPKIIKDAEKTFSNYSKLNHWLREEDHGA